MIVRISKETWESAMLKIGTTRNTHNREDSIVLRVIFEDETGHHSSFLGALHIPDEFLGKLYNPSKEYSLHIGALLKMLRFRDDLVELSINTPFDEQCKRYGFSRTLLAKPFVKITSILVYSIHEFVDEFAINHNKKSSEKIIVG